MKLKIIVLNVFILLSIVATAQIEKNKELSVTFGPASTKIKNKNISEDKYKDINDKNGFNINLLLSKYTRRVGFGIGLGYSTYNQEIYQKGLFESFSQKDRDGNLYDSWIASDITYTNKLSYLDIPITLHLLLGNSKRFYGFFDIGIVNQILIGGNYTMKGSIENMGRYETGNPYFFTLSQNNPYYSYKADLYDVRKEDMYETYSLSGHISLGLAAAMTDNLSLKIQPYANFGFSDITAKELRDIPYEDVFGRKSDYQKTKLMAIGLNVGFAYNIGNVKVQN